MYINIEFTSIVHIFSHFFSFFFIKIDNFKPNLKLKLVYHSLYPYNALESHLKLAPGSWLAFIQYTYMHEVTGDEWADNVFLISRASWGTERPWRVEEKQEWGDKHKNKDKYEQEVSENSNK